jgi:hypothetical protein
MIQQMTYLSKITKLKSRSLVRSTIGQRVVETAFLCVYGVDHTAEESTEATAPLSLLMIKNPTETLQVASTLQVPVVYQYESTSRSIS